MRDCLFLLVLAPHRKNRASVRNLKLKDKKYSSWRRRSLIRLVCLYINFRLIAPHGIWPASTARHSARC
jgi:hypothetical protein